MHCSDSWHAQRQTATQYSVSASDKVLPNASRTPGRDLQGCILPADSGPLLHRSHLQMTNIYVHACLYSSIVRIHKLMFKCIFLTPANNMRKPVEHGGSISSCALLNLTDEGAFPGSGFRTSWKFLQPRDLRAVRPPRRCTARLPPRARTRPAEVPARPDHCILPDSSFV